MNKKNRGRDLFKKYSRILNILENIISLLPKKTRIILLKTFRNKNGYSGLVVRFILVKSIAKYCGDNVSIHPGVYLFSIDKLSIGNNVSIHPMCYIDAGGEIEIGNDVSIAHSTTILSTTHNYNSLAIPIKDQGLTSKKTIIENNSWIGAKATVISGVRIHEGSIVGAAAVVTKNVASNTIVAGIPAKKIKDRIL